MVEFIRVWKNLIRFSNQVVWESGSGPSSVCIVIFVRVVPDTDLAGYPANNFTGYPADRITGYPAK